MAKARLLAAVGLAISLGACASTGARPRPFPTARSDESALPQKDGHAVARTALELRGTPYREGGADVHGFDCSGFTQYVFGRFGMGLPRAARDQFKLGRSVSRRDVTPGDLLFFSTVAPGASHVAIALDGDAFVHAPSSSGVVRVERLNQRYWSKRLVGVRRIVTTD